MSGKKIDKDKKLRDFVTSLTLKTDKVLVEVLKERENQEKKFGPQDHSPTRWLTFLGEEVGEANKAELEAYFEAKKGYEATLKLLEFRAELIQVATVAVAIVESLDRNELKPLKPSRPHPMENL